MTHPDFDHIQLSMVDDVVLIELTTPDIQGPTLAIELGTELQQVLAQAWAKRLLVDFQKVTYLSSTGFAVLFRLVTEARKKGVDVKLCGMDGGVEMGAGIVGLDKVTAIYDTQAEALESFKQA
jgi:anti-sigma B factor antagonist